MGPSLSPFQTRSGEFGAIGLSQPVKRSEAGKHRSPSLLVKEILSGPDLVRGHGHPSRHDQFEGIFDRDAQGDDLFSGNEDVEAGRGIRGGGDKDVQKIPSELCYDLPPWRTGNETDAIHAFPRIFN